MAVNKGVIDEFRVTKFLSCLYGSEQILDGKCQDEKFLSCLYGSERFDNRLRLRQTFLSCLYGSEHEVWI